MNTESPAVVVGSDNTSGAFAFLTVCKFNSKLSQFVDAGKPHARGQLLLHGLQLCEDSQIHQDHSCNGSWRYRLPVEHGRHCFDDGYKLLGCSGSGDGNAITGNIPLRGISSVCATYRFDSGSTNSFVTAFIQSEPLPAFRLFDKRSEARHKQTRISKRVKYVRGFGGLLK